MSIGSSNSFNFFNPNIGMGAAQAPIAPAPVAPNPPAQATIQNNPLQNTANTIAGLANGLFEFGAPHAPLHIHQVIQTNNNNNPWLTHFPAIPIGNNNIFHLNPQQQQLTNLSNFNNFNNVFNVPLQNEQLTQTPPLPPGIMPHLDFALNNFNLTEAPALPNHLNFDWLLDNDNDDNLQNPDNAPLQIPGEENILPPADKPQQP